MYASDDVFIKSYSNETGVVVLNSTLNFYHWGASESTSAAYNGVDMRGEVLLLTRNIIIEGEDIESWGCNIVTSDIVEFDLTMRFG
jgi:polygalacturonase